MIVMNGNTPWFDRFQDQGFARRLRGRVLIELVFVSDRKTAWMPNEIDRFYAVYQNALQCLQKQAVAAAVPLTFTTVMGQITYAGTVETGSTRSHVIELVCRQYLKKQGFPDSAAYVRARKQDNGVDEVAVIFVMERGFRAFAHPGSAMEYCALCQEDNEHTVAHELLHLFGAVDLYYPYQIYGLTMKYFPETIMCTLEGMQVDPLTQYLIGWKTEPTPQVREFLGKVKDFTVTRHNHANVLESCRNHEELLLPNAAPFVSVEEIRLESTVGFNPWAEYLLGLCYRDGIGLQKDEALAEKYFMRSGRTGLNIAAAAHAQLLLCRGLRTGQDRENLWLLLIYNTNDHMKLNSLSIACLLSGVGVGKDREKAVQDAIVRYQNEDWYRTQAKRSAKFYQIAEKYSSRIPPLHAAVKKLRMEYDWMLENGDPDLYYVIARLLEEGKSLQRDLDGAFALYKTAARGGNALACRELARCCRQGIGTSRDGDAARNWEAREIACRESNLWDAFCHVMKDSR